MEKDTVIILHLYYQDLWPEFKEYLLNAENYDLCISICKDHSKEIIQIIKKDFPKARILILENRGADIGPFFEWINILMEENRKYKYLLKIHSKKSLLNHKSVESSDLQRKECILPLIGTKQAFDKNIKILENKNVGMIGAKSKFISDSLPLHRNLKDAENFMIDFMKKFEIKTPRRAFFAGTMFWCRYDVIIKYLSRCRIRIDYFSPGSHSGKQTAAHAIERIFGRIFINENMKIVCVE